ncbi:carcinoembryonic antigen-related cell adhesion molecule 5-like isoform X2 [Actinia tenebrosa]|uniref:Carcinoembryonic antigen-related cell adhesion molecule 5-like isoform X2 n=1 Tax=Actinia tenebrosa TaxID=6105 RepID=A0A6P8HGQ2_ACTTE|nr:carcinoembryonic antigen-related cell adhesion molecule 5-like isoform X2 [Actinia tenebrosa]
MYYRISVYDDDPDSSIRTTKLNVDVPSSCKIYPDENITVNETDNVSLNVNTTGNPPVYEYIWTHPNGSTLTANSKLTFTASRQDTGTYNVSVYNGVGDRSICKRHITVQYRYPPDRITCNNKTVLEGDDVELVCSANGNPPPDMMWIRNGSIRGIGNTLMIRSVTKSESGTYTFFANNSLGYKSIAISITMQKRVKSPAIVNPYKQVLAVDEGEDVSLVCNASGNPVPNITWTKHGTVIGVGRIFNIAIARVKGNDSSCYTCTADNGIGHAKNASICLDVQYPPSDVKITPSSASLTLKEGDNLNLYCQSHSNPHSTYTWMYNGELLTIQQNSALIIKNINRRQNGLYRCEAKNRLGFVLSKPIKIIVQYLDPLEIIGSRNKSYSQSNPLVLFNLSINAYPSDTTLSCNPSAPNILTTITSHDASLTRKQYLVVVIIQDEVDFARIVCKAENGLGVRERTFYFYRQPILFKESFAGQFKIIKMEWQDDLKVAKSTGYNDLKRKCLKILESAYFDVAYLAAVNIKEFVKGSIIVRFELNVIGQVPDPLLPLRDYIKTQGEEINGLHIDYNSIQKSNDFKENTPIPCKEENNTLVAVLGVLFGLSIVLIIILIVGFLWSRRKDSKGISGKKSNTERHLTSRDKF